MLQYIRNKKIVYGIIIFLISAFIGLVYFEWGKGGSTGGSNEIAWVNGKSIYIEDIKPIYSQLKERYKDQITEENSDKIEKQIMIESIQILVQKYILLEQAKKAKVSVSDDEIFRAISRIKDFRTEDGRFNIGLYSRLPAFYKRKLEKDTKEDVTTQFFWIRLQDLVKVSDIDLRLFFQEENTECKIRFVMAEVEGDSRNQPDNLLNIDQERIKAEKIIDQFVKIVKRTRNFTRTAALLRLKVKTTDYFSFFQPIKKIDSDDDERYNEIEFQDIYVNTFKLKPFQISEKISLNKGFVVLQLLSKKEPNWDKFYKELPTLKMECEARVHRNVRNEWYRHVRSKARIRDSLDKFYKQK